MMDINHSSGDAKGNSPGVCVAWVAGLVLVIATILILVIYQYQAEDALHRERLLRQVVNVSSGFDATQIELLSGSERDLDLPVYQMLKRQLMLVQPAIQGCRFLYILGIRNGSVPFFYCDGESSQSDDYSPPGQLLEEVTVEELALYQLGKSFVIGPVKDRWGTWISALDPIRDPHDGRIVAWLGIDMDASAWRRSILREMRSFLIVTGILTLMLIVSVITIVWAGLRHRADRVWVHRMQQLAALSAGLLLTVYTAFWAQRVEDRALKKMFGQHAESEIQLLVARIKQLATVQLDAFARFVKSSDVLELHEFNLFTEPLLRDPLARALFWLPYVKSDERPEFERILSGGQGASRVIWARDVQRKRIQAPARPYHFPVLFVAPSSLMESICGHDHASEPDWRAAIESAMRLGLPVATSPTVLGYQRDEIGLDLLVYHPVYRDDRLLGLVGGALCTQELLRHIRDRDSVHVEISILHDTGTPLIIDRYCDVDFKHGEYKVDRYMMAYGLVLRISSHPGPTYGIGRPGRRGLAVLGAGILLTGLLVLLINTPHRRRVQLERLVDERTTDLQRAEKLLERRLRHEQVLATVSRQAMTVPDIDMFMREAMRIMGSMLDISRVYLFVYHAESGIVENTHEWCAEGIEPQIDNLRAVPVAEIPWWHDELRHGRPVVAGDIADIPDPGARAILRSQGIKAVNAVSMMVSGIYYGFIGFDDCVSARSWPPEDVDMLESFARILATVIERSQSLEALANRETQYRLLAENASDVIIALDAATMTIDYISPSVERMLGYYDHEVMEKPGAFPFMDSSTREELVRFIGEISRQYEKGGRWTSTREMTWLTHHLEPIWVEVVFRPFTADAGGLKVQATAREITDRKHNEERIRRQVEELEQWRAATSGRERKVLELKCEVNALLVQMGQPARYEECA